VRIGELLTNTTNDTLASLFAQVRDVCFGETRIFVRRAIG
jgi:hypothetical protein